MSIFHKPAVAFRSRVLKCCGPRLQHLIKKLYYPGWISRYNEDNWLCSAAVKELVKPGDHVIDIGANIGYVSYLLSQWVGPAGQVYSFEPVPDTFDILAHNMRKLKISNVAVHHCAVSDRNAVGTIGIPQNETGDPDYYRAHLLTGGVSDNCFSQSQIPIRTLDSFLTETDDKIRFIKIDVEGHEQEVIEGGRKLLEKAKPILMIEVEGDPDQPGSSANHLFTTLKSMEYEPYIDDGSQLRPRNSGEQRNDYFFVPT